MLNVEKFLWGPDDITVRHDGPTLSLDSGSDYPLKIFFMGNRKAIDLTCDRLIEAITEIKDANRVADALDQARQRSVLHLHVNRQEPDQEPNT